eukprot:IDg3415t1
MKETPSRQFHEQQKLDVPVFSDHSDPKMYRRILYDWIRFQDLAEKNSSKNLRLVSRYLQLSRIFVEVHEDDSVILQACRLSLRQQTRRYSYAHGQAAQSTGVQELIALLCVLNANLDRSEFTVVLHGAMECQKDMHKNYSQISIKRNTVQYGPMSAKDVLSQVSKSNFVTDTSTSGRTAEGAVL